MILIKDSELVIELNFLHPNVPYSLGRKAQERLQAYELFKVLTHS